MTGCSNGSNSGEDSCRSGIRGIAAPMSAAVMTAQTPGRARAAPVLDAADAPVRDRTAQDHGVQKVVACEVVDELAAAAQEAKVLDAFDRAADEGVACTLLVHAHHLTGRRGKSALLGNLHADKIQLISRSSHAG